MPETISWFASSIKNSVMKKLIIILSISAYSALSAFAQDKKVGDR